MAFPHKKDLEKPRLSGDGRPFRGLPVLVGVALAFSAIPIGFYASGSAGTEVSEAVINARIDTLTQVQEELLRTVEIEIDRLQSQNRRATRARQTTSTQRCGEMVDEMLDFLKAQIKKRLTDYAKSKLKEFIMEELRIGRKGYTRSDYAVRCFDPQNDGCTWHVASDGNEYCY